MSHNHKTSFFLRKNIEVYQLFPLWNVNWQNEENSTPFCDSKYWCEDQLVIVPLHKQNDDYKILMRSWCSVNLTTWPLPIFPWSPLVSPSSLTTPPPGQGHLLCPSRAPGLILHHAAYLKTNLNKQSNWEIILLSFQDYWRSSKWNLWLNLVVIISIKIGDYQVVDESLKINRRLNWWGSLHSKRGYRRLF